VASPFLILEVDERIPTRNDILRRRLSAFY
jgi:hypothetical protein